MSAILSFLGGSAFRAIWGEVSSYLQKRQDHAHEKEMVLLNAQLEDARHKRVLEQQEQASRLQINVIEAKSDATVEEAEVNAWLERVRSIERPTGVAWLDVVRGLVQPLLAYIAIIIWLSALASAGWVITEWDRELVSAIFGMYLANRHLSARGK